MAGFRVAGEQNVLTRDEVHAAATATEERAMFVAPCPCLVTKIEYSPDVATTGDNTNTTNLAIVNKGAAGAGATQVAAKALPTGTNLVAFDAHTIALVGAAIIAAGGIALAEGDVLTVQYTKVGTGVLVGPGTFQFYFVRT